MSFDYWYYLTSSQQTDVDAHCKIRPGVHKLLSRLTILKDYIK